MTPVMTDNLPTEWRHHIGRRCPKMDQHLAGELAEPCPDCFSVEAITRSVPYQPQHVYQPDRDSGYDRFTLPLDEVGITVIDTVELAQMRARITPTTSPVMIPILLRWLRDAADGELLEDTELPTALLTAVELIENAYVEPPSATCGCYRCTEAEQERQIASGADMITALLSRMIGCDVCGAKRCPHATDHRLACTGSNEPGQPGSRFA